MSLDVACLCAAIIGALMGVWWGWLNWPRTWNHHENEAPLSNAVRFDRWEARADIVLGLRSQAYAVLADQGRRAKARILRKFRAIDRKKARAAARKGLPAGDARLYGNEIHLVTVDGNAVRSGVTAIQKYRTAGGNRNG